MTKRYIRLKEFQPCKTDIVFPTEDYLVARPNLNPNLSYFVSTNTEGYLVSSPQVKSSNKIFLMGDSSIENKYCGISERVQSVLQKKIIQNGYDYEVLNAGYSGANMLHLLNNLTNKIIKNELATVILTIPSNDFGTLLSSKKYWRDDKFGSNIFPYTVERSPDDEELKNTIISLYRMIRSFISICKNFNINLYILPVMSKSLTKYEMIDTAACKICEEENIPFINFKTESAFLEQVIPYGFSDYLHLNQEGSNVIANIIYRRIKISEKSDYKNGYLVIKLNHKGPSFKLFVYSSISLYYKSQLNQIFEIDIPVAPKEKPCHLEYTFIYNREENITPEITFSHPDAVIDIEYL